MSQSWSQKTAAADAFQAENVIAAIDEGGSTPSEQEFAQLQTQPTVSPRGLTAEQAAEQERREFAREEAQHELAAERAADDARRAAERGKTDSWRSGERVRQIQGLEEFRLQQEKIERQIIEQQDARLEKRAEM